jgi:energy-coupling factor transport system ATP-binding protein
MIQLNRVVYQYPNTAGPVLDGVTLRIDEGELILVIGPSGSGKSTFLRCLNGVVPHFYGGTFSGTVRLAGLDPVKREPRGMSSTVGLVLQDPEAQFVVDTVEDELAFAMENQGLSQTLMRKRIEEVLDQLSIALLRQRRISTLSGGEKQRVAIASVLTLQPKVLVLDEPTSQLDPQAAEEVLTVLQKLNEDLGLTVILSEHRLERVAQYADRILWVPGQGGEFVLGTPADVLAQVDLTPPLISLAKALNWSPLPLTIKRARPFARRAGLVRERDPEDEVLAVETRRPRDNGMAVSVRDLWHSYPGSHLPALRGADLSVESGEFLALMGRNGSGKSTLLKHLVGLLKAERGEVMVVGRDCAHTSLDDLTKWIGYVPQNPGALLFKDTVREELDFTRQNHGLPAQDYGPLLRMLGLEAHIDRYPRDLSVGERQRVALASILVVDPQIILLDEPTRGLDYPQKYSLARFLMAQKERGRTVIMCTHDVELVALCADRVVILGEGEVVVDGPTRKVMTSSMVFSSQVNKLLRDDRFLTVDDVLAYCTPAGTEAGA